VALKLFNVVKVWDVWVVSESPEEARGIVDTFIRQENLPISEETAIETKNERDIRDAWRGEKPLVANDVSDADFERVKGKTTLQTFEMLHKRDPKKASDK
jgi:hypothetical protein